MARAYPAIPLEDLSLEKLVPVVPILDAEFLQPEERKKVKKEARAAADQVVKLGCSYIKWLKWQHNPTNSRDVHQISPYTEVACFAALEFIAKYLYRDQTDHHYVNNYHDVPVVEALRQKINEASGRARDWKPQVDMSMKWMNWAEYCQLVDELKQCCAQRSLNHSRRPKTAIAYSYVKYLMFAFLRYMPPDRGRTFRELEVHHTLKRGQIKDSRFIEADWDPERKRYHNDKDASWYICLKSEDYKTGPTYKDAIDRVPEVLYPELTAWLYGYEDESGNWQGYEGENGQRSGWRDVLKPTHNFVFTRKRGKPFSESDDLHKLFIPTASRRTGKMLNPHLVRNIAVTHFEEKGSPEVLMKSLRQGMRHSWKTQQFTYNERKPWTRSELATQALLDG